MQTLEATDLERLVAQLSTDEGKIAVIMRAVALGLTSEPKYVLAAINYLLRPPQINYDHVQQALDIANKSGSLVVIAGTWERTGYFRKAAELREQLGDYRGAMRLYEKESTRFTTTSWWDSKMFKECFQKAEEAAELAGESQLAAVYTRIVQVLCP